MFRLWFMTFFGELKLGEVDHGEEAHKATLRRMQHTAQHPTHTDTLTITATAMAACTNRRGS